MSSKQVDLFLDSLVNAPLRDDRATMEFPFFSLQKRPRTDPMVYDDGRVKILIEPGPKGIATIWDKDVLIYLASLINDRLERGLPVEREVRFNAYDLLTVTGRGTGKQAYELLKDALHRLRSTSITTTIEVAGERQDRGFGWIADWTVITRVQTNGQRVMGAVKVILNDWMFNAIVKERRVLSIDRGYFDLTGGLERRLYELARKHVGMQPEWTILLPRLAEKAGSTTELKEFKREMLRIVEADVLPSYQIALEVPLGRRGVNERILVRFSPRRPVDM